MELRQLQHFVVLADQLNFTKAASSLHIGQSGLSASIRALEVSLGTELLARTTRSVILTDTGEALLPEARKLVAAASATREMIRARLGLSSGVLRVGTIPSFGGLDYPAILAEFHESFPAVEVRITVDSGDVTLGALSDGDLEIAFVSLPPRLPNGLESTVLTTEPEVLVCSPSHPLSAEEIIDLAMLEGETFVEFNHDSVVHVNHDSVFAEKGISRAVSYSVDNVNELLAMVGRGAGVALVPRPIAALNPSVVMRPIAGHALTWTLAVVLPMPDAASSAARALRRIAQRSIPLS